MRQPIATLVVFVLLTLAAGAVGGWLGILYGERLGAHRDDLNTVVHRKLGLTAAQNARIEALEEEFAARRKHLEAEMRVANRDLAMALKADHALSPRARIAMDSFNSAERALQEATIMHVLAMRAVLTEKQSRTFDQAVYEALTAGPP